MLGVDEVALCLSHRAALDARAGVQAAVGELLPIAIQGSVMHAPLAWVIMGGLVSSALLACIVTAVMYKLIAPTVVHHVERLPVASAVPMPAAREPVLGTY